MFGLIVDEVKIEQFLFTHLAGPLVVEMELLEEANGWLAFHEGVEGDLQELVFAAELNGGFHQGRADAAAAGILADAQAADLADAGFDLLYADGSEDLAR